MKLTAPFMDIMLIHAFKEIFIGEDLQCKGDESNTRCSRNNVAAEKRGSIVFKNVLLKNYASTILSA